MHWNAPVQLQQLYLGHGLPKYEVKVETETMLVFSCFYRGTCQTRLGTCPSSTVLGETPYKP